MRITPCSAPPSLRRRALGATLLLLAGSVHASVGLTQTPGTDADAPVTVFYPSTADAQTVRRGPFEMALAENGRPVRGNGRLVVVSHGSGGSPWVHTALARSLVQAGFVVAFPQHRADNARDTSAPGPESWSRRPGEVSRAIDAIAADPRFAPLLDLQRVGLYGMSAGGHTALSLAGGRWSPANFRDHCLAHLEDDFNACVGLITRLSGGVFDGVRTTVARWVIRSRFDDARLRRDSDPRIAAIVAAVPAAADFDVDSLAAPAVPLGLVRAGGDRWLAPRFHAERVLKACTTCERIADLPTAGHGALLSPLPPNMTGLEGDLLNDPPGFDRAALLPEVDRRITAFFVRLLAPV